ncbi:hypothetical protein [Flindersiella endophytica]
MVQVAEGARRINVREVGRWRLLRRSVAIAAVLLLVQLPLILAVRAGDPVGRLGLSGTCEIPGRLSILVDLLFIYTYLPAAWRGRWFIMEKQPAETVLGAVSLLGTTLVTLAALLDLVENLVLWRRFASAVLPSGACASLEVATLTPLVRTLWVAGVVLLFFAFLACLNPVHRRLPWLARLSRPLDRARERMRRAVVVEPQGERSSIALPASVEGGTVICCSGGGIRSAAFSLGALQLFSEKGLYQKASAVIGVSGGGYLAAAFHVVRKSLRLEDPPPFAPGSPELARLRRRTRYLLPSVAVSARGIMSLVYGVVVNLVLAAVLLRGISWLLGWAIHEAGILGPDDRSAQYRDLPLWYWIAALGPLALAVGIFLVEATVDRFHVPPRLLRTEARDFAQWLTIPALITPVLFLGVPWVIARFIAWREPVAAGAPAVAATGVEVLLNTELGVAVVGGLGAALLALARSAWKGFTEAGTVALTDGMVAQVAGWLRVRLVPWLGTVLIAVVGLVVLLGWTTNYARSTSTWRDDWDVAATCAALVLVIRVFTDATRMSLHPYYRERLANAYLVRRTDGEALPYEYTLPMPYSDWARTGGTADGGPELVVVAAASAFDRDFVPADRNCVPFVFDPHRTGVVGDVSLPPQGMVRTDAYERRADYRRRDVTVPGAIAISGAAFSPLTGRDYFRTRPMRLLFAMVNARLGVWLPNPYWGTSSSSASFADRCRAAADAGKLGPFGGLVAFGASGWAHIVSLVDKPGPYRLFKEAFGATSLYDRRLYVTDGGHYDQLGLVEALRRRPDRIIVVDASNDTEDVFTSVGLAIATARMDLGVEIELDLRPMRRGDDGVRAERAWAHGTATCPDGKTIELYVLKALLTPDLPWDVEAYAARHPEFPRRTTGDQLYGEFDFEAYRELGHHLAGCMATRLAEQDRPQPDFR